MEKRFEKSVKRVVITGPESTGKSWLSRQLSLKTGGLWLPEYARFYVEFLGRNYSEDDVLKIAKVQIDLENQMAAATTDYLFIDTGLIITKVWLEHVYGRSPKWLDEAIRTQPRHMYLLCKYDLPWIPDPLRENPDLREFLFDWYKRELDYYGMNYHVIEGIGNKRLENALRALKMIK